MNRNVEIKAKAVDLAATEEKVKRLADEGPVLLEQEDVFFQSPHGRLKLRRFAGAGRGELIAYDRPDASGPKESRYVVHQTGDPDGLCDVLTEALGLRGIVRKRRTFYRIGQTRVHLDRVEGLGEFVELEVVLGEKQDAREGTAIARELMRQLGISEDRLLKTAYIDIIDARMTP
ncbi:MAG: class IV adenylate cyclase [Phycisphaerales bacterium]